MVEALPAPVRRVVGQRRIAVQLRVGCRLVLHYLIAVIRVSEEPVQHRDLLFQRLRRMETGLGAFPLLVIGQQLGHVFELLAVQRGPHPILPVHRHMEIFIDQPDLVQDRFPEKCGLLGDEPVSADKITEIERPLRPHLDEIAVLVDYLAIAVDQVDMAVGAKEFGHLAQGPGLVGIVRVQPGDHLAGGPRPSLVNGPRLAIVLFAHPIGEPRLVLLDDLDAAVSRTAIDDHVFQVGISLEQNGTDGLLQKPGLIVGRRDDTDAWRCRSQRRFIAP